MTASLPLLDPLASAGPVRDALRRPGRRWMGVAVRDRHAACDADVRSCAAVNRRAGMRQAALSARNGLPRLPLNGPEACHTGPC